MGNEGVRCVVGSEGTVWINEGSCGLKCKLVRMSPSRDHLQNRGRYPPHTLSVVVGDGQGSPLGGHINTVQEAGTKIKLHKGEVHLWLHPRGGRGHSQSGEGTNLKLMLPAVVFANSMLQFLYRWCT